MGARPRGRGSVARWVPVAGFTVRVFVGFALIVGEATVSSYTEDMSPRRFIERLLISPYAALSPDRERQVRHFSGLLLVVLVVGVALAIAYMYEVRDFLRETALDHIVATVTLLIILGLYFVNRSGRFVVAAMTTVSIATLAILLSAIPSASTNELQMLHYLAIPIVLSGLVLSVRFTVIIAGVSIAGVVAFPLIFEIPGGSVPISAITLIGAFVVIAAHHRRQVERDRRSVLQASEARFADLATHDALTGLPNRLLFAEETASAIARAARQNMSLGVLFVDIDNFKAINDALGHDAGDELLIHVGRRLRETLRGGDVVSRQGGDEFCILVDALPDPQVVASVVQKVLHQLRGGFTLSDRDVYVTASIGVSIYPDDGSEPGELIRRADTALYTAKDGGKDTFVFYSSKMSEEATLKLQLAADLQHAIERGEIGVVFQPQVDARSGSVVGVECLARWTHPERGPVSPGLFVPLAEQSGLITELTAFVGRAAIDLQSKLGALEATSGAPPVRVAINVSERDLRSERLVDWIAAMMETSGLMHHHLELELTENIVFRSLDRARPMLERLKDLGVKIAVDDFGAGFATLRQIADFPIDVVKIDRSFVRSITGTEHEAIIAGIVEIASRLDIQLVAEGVETESELRTLLDLGCTVVQGWYYSRAVPADQLVSLARTGFAAIGLHW